MASVAHEVRQHPPRKLIVCCDGTWNQRLDPGAVTNVAKMARAIRPQDDEGISQLIYCHPGVGIGNVLDKFIGGAVGEGLSANLQSAYSFLVDNFLDGDLIFLFGFSRGAYTVRSLAGLVSLVGLMEKADMDLFDRVYEIYRSREHRKTLVLGAGDKLRTALSALFPGRGFDGLHARLVEALDRSRRTNIFFIGVWDTVGSLGIPSGPIHWRGDAESYRFHDTEISNNVVYAYHALAIDERRGNFRPTLWTRLAGRGSDPQARTQVLEQVWFAGGHSNVGGGYDDAGLSDIPFLWMIAKAAAARLERADRPLAFNLEYIERNIARSMGAAVDECEHMPWRILPKYTRPVLAPPDAGKETCERIHRSVVFRYGSADVTAFSPYPYRPGNARTFLATPDMAQIAELSPLENRYRSWP
jgi:uncharacterized protein (DUF2235 family)